MYSPPTPTPMGVVVGVVAVCRLHHTELQEMDDAEDRLDRTIELSMVEQCMNIVKTGLVQRHQVKYGFPRIHGFVYNLLDGELKELDVDL
ncbi:hypothetical protein Poli38472_014605 [Pythium oligandrum]|uniref:Carbonic anhydrase n=1 Tax=Pythium oligandrum TaxID=41045 RepID=A0A8K1FMU0_PYTOL|nr:hypothetical protein Poli38472_014605 [Pythium oligandrum]|eukprot:TMW66629.1 hypothetical protein Poli38472_014605 [Pythium oligandrum]